MCVHYNINIYTYIHTYRVVCVCLIRCASVLHPPHRTKVSVCMCVCVCVCVCVWPQCTLIPCHTLTIQTRFWRFCEERGYRYEGLGFRVCVLIRLFRHTVCHFSTLHPPHAHWMWILFCRAAQFTCFTSTRVQILTEAVDTLLPLVEREPERMCMRMPLFMPQATNAWGLALLVYAALSY
jgi:hypothetical protein